MRRLKRSASVELMVGKLTLLMQPGNGASLNVQDLFDGIVHHSRGMSLKPG
jgi:hypothetical protein